MGSLGLAKMCPHFFAKYGFPLFPKRGFLLEAQPTACLTVNGPHAVWEQY